MVRYSSKCVIKMLCSTEMLSLMNFLKIRLILIYKGNDLTHIRFRYSLSVVIFRTMVNRCCAYSMDVGTLSFPLPFF